MHSAPRRGGTPGSLYLCSSGKAPTEFWSEELEKAAERMRASIHICNSTYQGTPTATLGSVCAVQKAKAKCKEGLMPGLTSYPQGPGCKAPPWQQVAAKPQVFQAAAARATAGDLAPPAGGPARLLSSSCWLGRKGDSPRGCLGGSPRHSPEWSPFFPNT